MKKDTRTLLLDSAFNEFYKNGYQGASISTILGDVGINKGSMYHFFKSKKALALAVIQERIALNLKEKYQQLLEEENCFEALFTILRSAPTTLIYGCPLNKMAQEMSYLDSDFKKELSSVYLTFETSIEAILKQTILQGLIPKCDTHTTSKLIISTYEGALMIYHLTQNSEDFKKLLTQLQKKLIQ